MSTYPSIRIEGGLLGPDVLDQLLAGELPGQRPADFGVEARRNLTDEIAAAFADARALWGVFQHRLERIPADDPATGVTRDAWMIPFLGLLGYEPRYNQKAYEIDGLTFAISHRAGEADVAPPVHIVGARQELGRVPASGRPRLAPHSLVQEYLNRTENLWGVVTNGQTLRLLRDCTFVRRQAYVEFDLPAILDEQRFQDFAALYRLLHRTRLPRGIEDAADCWLEKYYVHSVEQGGRVREHLRDGVEQCITLLANGFLRHAANGELRRRVVVQASRLPAPATSTGGTPAPQLLAGNKPDRITPDSLYRQLLILVYRFLFLLVSEDRGLLSTDPLYREHYSVARLRRMLDIRAAFTEYDDLWQSLRVLWLVLIKDQPQPALGNRPMAAVLGLPVLNGDLFAPQFLDTCSISDRDLLHAFWHLAWYREDRSSPPRRVNYAALDVEELGSVYESLLEFHPAVDPDHAGRPVFSFVTGSERKTTGSYYTPPELVAELIKTALEPVLAERLAAAETATGEKSAPSPRLRGDGRGEGSGHGWAATAKERAILSIRVCDPACGSGNFLLAAARRLGKELARVRTGEDKPAPERVRESVRDVIAHCIYGVDSRFKFVTFTVSSQPVAQTDFAFFLTRTEHLRDTRRRFTLSAEDLALFNPNTRTCPVFRSRADAELTRKIYQRVPVLLREGQQDGNPWGIRFMTMFHMSNDSHLFAEQPGDGLLRLYEAKLMHQFDHRWATYESDVGTRDLTTEEKVDPSLRVRPRYWVTESAVLDRLAPPTQDEQQALAEGKLAPHELLYRQRARAPQWLLGFRDITNATNERTAIFSFLPRVGVGNNAPLMLLNVREPDLQLCLLGNLNALVFDYCARQKIGGTHMNFFLVQQLPVFPPGLYNPPDVSYVSSRVASLVNVADDLRVPCSYAYEPVVDEARRAQVRAELDAWFACAYGLSRDELRYILDPQDVFGPDFPGETFRVLKEKELARFGEYRTRRLVLEAWDRWEREHKSTRIDTDCSAAPDA